MGLDPGEDPIVWIFGLELPDLPAAAWRAVKLRLDPKADHGSLQAGLFEAAHELWRHHRGGPP